MVNMLMTDTSTVRFASSRSTVPAFIRMAMGRVASMFDVSPVYAMPAYAMAATPAPSATGSVGHSFVAMTRWLDDADLATCGATGNPTAVKRIHPGRLGGVT